MGGGGWRREGRQRVALRAAPAAMTASAQPCHSGCCHAAAPPAATESGQRWWVLLGPALVEMAVAHCCSHVRRWRTPYGLVSKSAGQQHGL